MTVAMLSIVAPMQENNGLIPGPYSLFCELKFACSVLKFSLEAWTSSYNPIGLQPTCPLGLTGNSKLEVDESGAGFLFFYDNLVTCPECHLAFDLIQLEWILGQHPPQTNSDG